MRMNSSVSCQDQTPIQFDQKIHKKFQIHIVPKGKGKYTRTHMHSTLY